MPEVLGLLKIEREMKRQDIVMYMRFWIEKNGFAQRDRFSSAAISNDVTDGFKARSGEAGVRKEVN